MSHEIIEKIREMTKQAVLTGLNTEDREALLRAFKFEQIDTNIVLAYIEANGAMK